MISKNILSFNNIDGNKNLLVICTYNRMNDLKKLFNSFYDLQLQSTTIIIVDATDNNDLIYWEWVNLELNNLIQKLSNKNIYWFPHKKGLTLQRNFALRLARQNNFSYIHFIDDDTELERDYISEMSKALTSQFDIVGATGLRIGEKFNDNESYSSFIHLFYSTILNKICGITKAGGVSKSGLNFMAYGDSVYFVDWLSGCSMSYAISNLRYAEFSEEFSDYSLIEDLDFSYRVGKYGKLLYWPMAKLKHNISQKNRWEYLRSIKVEAHNRTIFVLNNRKELSLTRHIFYYLVVALRLSIQSIFKKQRLLEIKAIFLGVLRALLGKKYI